MTVKMGVKDIEGQSGMHDERSVIITAWFDLPIPPWILRHTLNKEGLNVVRVLPQGLSEATSLPALQLAQE
jgi:hypothetical protein